MARNKVTGNYMNNIDVLDHSGLTFDGIRNQVTAMHFAKETLSETELKMLAMLEDLVDLMDNPPAPF